MDRSKLKHLPTSGEMPAVKAKAPRTAQSLVAKREIQQSAR